MKIIEECRYELGDNVKVKTETTINGQKILVDMIGYISQIRLIHKDKKTLIYTYGIVPKLDMANLFSAIPTCYVNSGLILCKFSDGDK